MENPMLKEHFDLSIALLRSKQNHAAAVAARRQAIFDQREARQAQVLYGSSFKCFRDKLTGRKEETETALRHAVQHAEAALAAAEHTVSVEAEKIAQLEQSLSRLPPWDSLKTADTESLWYRLEALYCAEFVLPLLEVNLNLLLERRNQANGGNAGQLQSRYEIADIYTAPEKAGDACRPYILRLNAALEALDAPLPVHTYFLEPAAFLNSATKYNRFGRMNEAVSQTEAIIRCISTLRQTLKIP